MAIASTAHAPQPHRPGRLYLSTRRLQWTPVQGRALRRVASVRALAALRSAHGELPNSRAAIAEVLADAVSKLGGRGGHYLDVPGLTRYLPECWRDDIGPDVLHAAALPARTPDLLDDAAAGRLLGLTLDELQEMAERGHITSLHPVDEPAEARALRRSRRRRDMAKERVRKWRLKVAASRNASSNEDKEAFPAATFASTQAGRVCAAIEGGAVTLPAIVAITGLNLSTLKPILCRMVHAGRIERAGRGKYLPAGAGCGAASPTVPTRLPREPAQGEEREVAARSTANSGPAVQRSRQEPASKVSNTPTVAMMASTGRAPDARGTVGGCTPHTPAGPDGRAPPAPPATRGVQPQTTRNPLLEANHADRSSPVRAAVPPRRHSGARVRFAPDRPHGPRNPRVGARGGEAVRAGCSAGGGRSPDCRHVQQALASLRERIASALYPASAAVRRVAPPSVILFPASMKELSHGPSHA